MSQNSFTRHVGIDVSKSTLDVYFLPEHKHMKVANSIAGIRQILTVISSHKEETGIILEATGGYERLALDHLSCEGAHVCLTNPTPVYHFRKSLDIAAKTDKVDAKILALYAQARQDLRYGVYRQSQQAMIDLQHACDQLKKVRSQEKNRLSQTVNTIARKAHQRIINALEKQITELEREIAKRIKEDDDYRLQYELLNTIKGIGDKVSASLICMLPEMGKVSHKALKRLVGVAPITNDSGIKRGKRTIQGGRQAVRDALYMSALVAAQHDPVMRAYYQRKLKEGKKKKVALVACMAKLVRIINSVIANGQPYVCPASIN